MPEDTRAVATWGDGPENPDVPDCLDGAGFADLAHALHEQRGRAVRYEVPSTGTPHPIQAGRWRWALVETWEQEARRLRAVFARMEQSFMQLMKHPAIGLTVARDATGRTLAAAVRAEGSTFEERRARVLGEHDPLLHPWAGTPTDPRELAAALAAETRASTISEPLPPALLGVHRDRGSVGPRAPILVTAPSLFSQGHGPRALDDGMGDPRPETAPVAEVPPSPLAASVRRG